MTSMQNVVQMRNNNADDLDQIRNSLKRNGLTYPADSTDERYRKFLSYIKTKNVPIATKENFDFGCLAPEDHPLSEVAQCRSGNANQEKIEDFEARFRNGEQLQEPIIGTMWENYFFPLFGNQRSRAMKRAQLKSTVIVVAHGYEFDDVCTVCVKLSNLSNRATTTDVDVDSREDISYQMKNEWCRVIGVESTSTNPVSQGYIEAKRGYNNFLNQEDSTGADSYRREYFQNWFQADKPRTLSANEKSAKAQFGRYYSEAFNEDIKQRLNSDYHAGKQQEIYNSFWSAKLIDSEGNEKELYIWDKKVHSWEADSTTVQMEQFGTKNPIQNTRRLVLEQFYAKDRKCEYIEVMIRPYQGLRDLTSIRDFEEKALNLLAEFNNNPKHKTWGLPLFSKVILLKHVVGEHDDNTAHEWKTTPTIGYWEVVPKK